MLRLSDWPYIKQTPMCGDLSRDAAAFLNANGKETTAKHCAAVAEKGTEIAERFGLDKDIICMSAVLHDISAVMRRDDMLTYAVSKGWEIDEAERRQPFLLHQRISAVFARDIFNLRDAKALSAIKCHTTLKDNPTSCDMALFLADKLAWDQEGVPPFRAIIEAALNESLEKACSGYINHALDNGMILMPHTWLLEAKAWLKERR
ncbi:MAG: HD domain-containing protein [Christensenellales bacterium]|jgi:HD superfamily phosphohydrolase YqeK